MNNNNSLHDHDNNDDKKTTNILTSSPPWEVLVLVSHLLDPKSLAISCCVSKTWFSCFSSDHLWSPVCSAHFPSLSSLSSATCTPLRRLYSLGHAASLLRRRPPRRPNLSLHRLLFTVSLDPLLAMVKPCRELEQDAHGLFRFEFDVEGEGTVEDMREVRVTWNVVAVGGDGKWEGVFTMAEESGHGGWKKKGGGGFATSFGVDGWFSEELLAPPGMMSSGLVADLRLGVAGVEGDCGRVRVEKMSLGVISLLNWRYVTVDETLSYLDHFLPMGN